MANTVRILITAKDEVSGQLDKIRDKASLLSKTDIGKGMAQGAGIAAFNVMKGAALGALDAVGSFAIGSVKAASDSREAMALTSQVFEGSAKSIEEWSKNSRDAFSSTEAMAFAASFGTAFKNVGMSLDETTAKAKVMTTVAGDLGSAFNTSSEEAATALRSGLLGESEPMRRFGVFMDEAKTKAKALAMGMTPLNGAFTDGQKVAARYALIMEQTADSQGMFGRDTGSLADKQKLLGTAIDDLQVKIGTGLVGPLGDVVTAASDTIAVLDDLGEALAGVGEAMPDGWADDIIHDLGPESNVGSSIKGLLDLIGTVPTKFRLAFDSENITRESLLAYRASERLGESYEGLTGTAPKAADAVAEVGKAAKTTRPAVQRLAEPVFDLAGAYKDVDRWASEAAETLLQNDPKQLTLAYKGTVLALKDEKSELKDVQGEIEKRHKKGLHATREQRIEENLLKQSIEETKDETVTLGLKLVASGKMTYDQLRKELAKLGIVLDKDADEAARLAYHLKRADDLYRAPSQRGNQPRNRPDAAGGPVAPYESAIVGEYRPETIRMGAVGGMVNPSASGGSGGGSVSVNLNVSTPVMTPGAAQALADAIAPAITRWQQARGV
jgi:hypothetical protein